MTMPIPQVAPFRLSDYIGQGVQDASGMFRLSEAMQNAPIQRELGQQQVQLGRESLARAPLETELLKTQISQAKQTEMLQGAFGLFNKYQSDISSGKTPAQSLAEIEPINKQLYDSFVSKGYVDPKQMPYHPWDPSDAQTKIMSNPQTMKMFTEYKNSNRQTQVLEEKIHHDIAMEDLASKKEDRMAKQQEAGLKLRQRSVDAQVKHLGELTKQLKTSGKLEKDFGTRVAALQKEARGIIGNINIDANTKAFMLEDIHNQLQEMTTNLETAGGNAPASVSSPTLPPPEKKTGTGFLGLTGSKTEPVPNPITRKPIGRMAQEKQARQEKSTFLIQTPKGNITQEEFKKQILDANPGKSWDDPEIKKIRENYGVD